MSDELYDFDEFARRVLEEFDAALAKIGKFNLAVFGDTGAGKSTLVNAVFGFERAATGIGDRETTLVELYRSHEDDPLGIYDTPGFEIGTGELSALVAEVRGIVEGLRKGPENDRMHAVWFVVNAQNGRFLGAHADLVRALHDLGLPVLMVFTRAVRIDGKVHPDVAEFERKVIARGLPLVGERVFFVNSKELVEMSGAVHPPQGLKELLDATVETIPEAARIAALTAQVLDFTHQRAMSKKAMKAASLAAFGTQLAPIGIDVAGFTLVLAGMMATISAFYGVPVDKQALVRLSWKVFVGGNVAKQGASWVADEVAKRTAEKAAKETGKKVAKQAGKFIPGVNVVIAAVSTAVAAPMMYAVGYAWMDVCEYIRTHPDEIAADRESSVGALFLKCYRERMADRRPNWMSRLMGTGRS